MAIDAIVKWKKMICSIKYTGLKISADLVSQQDIHIVLRVVLLAEIMIFILMFMRA